MDRNCLIEQLHTRGLKVTPQRLAVIDVLADFSHLHPGAGHVYKEARKKIKSISLSTVYAILSELSQHGMIKTIEFDQKENRYEVNPQEHINLICRRCGRITDYAYAPSVSAVGIARELGFVVTDTRMDYYGYCRDCLADRSDAVIAPEDQGGDKK